MPKAMRKEASSGCWPSCFAAGIGTQAIKLKFRHQKAQLFNMTKEVINPAGALLATKSQLYSEQIKGTLL
jgi:hypothetical protein